MAKKSAVTEISLADDCSKYTNLCLYFDKIYVDNIQLTSVLSSVRHNNVDPIQVQLDKLKKQKFYDSLAKNDILIPYDRSKFNISKIRNAIESLMLELGSNSTNYLTTSTFSTQDEVNHEHISRDINVRMGILYLQAQNVHDVFPVLKNATSYRQTPVKQQAINVILNQLPTPSADVDLKQLLEFRSDADVHSKYLALINWINELGRTQKTASEIEDEFEYLYNQYLRHYELHKMKSNWTTLEVLVSTGLDALASLSSPVQVLKSMFAIRKSKISLMEEEMKLPGKEIAYIYKANETFG